MIIERLEFDKSEYEPDEASIHVARYQLARSYIKGKRVLDIACGEGYGTLLLKKWGADNVVGVDISTEAIDSAKRNFLTDGIEFVCGEVDVISDFDKFDVIISCETIEHVKDDLSFLSCLKKLLKSNGVFIITCPNDYFYYKDDEFNPFHVKKYTYEMFLEVITKVFGTPQHIGLGTNIFGFANYTLGEEKFNTTSSLDIIKYNIVDVLVGMNIKNNLPTESNSLYYYAIFGNNKDPSSANVYYKAPLNHKISYLENLPLVVSSMENMINDRDSSIKSMENMINDRDSSIKSLENMINDRDSSIKSMENMINDRDSSIKSMENMINDRDSSIKSMENMINDRDLYIRELEDIINNSSNKSN